MRIGNEIVQKGEYFRQSDEHTSLDDYQHQRRATKVGDHNKADMLWKDWKKYNLGLEGGPRCALVRLIFPTDYHYVFTCLVPSRAQSGKEKEGAVMVVLWNDITSSVRVVRLDEPEEIETLVLLLEDIADKESWLSSDDLKLTRAMLLHGADVNAKGYGNMTALHWAVISQNKALAATLRLWF